jgi:hypothetical protein
MLKTCNGISGVRALNNMNQAYIDFHKVDKLADFLILLIKTLKVEKLNTGHISNL